MTLLCNTAAPLGVSRRLIAVLAAVGAPVRMVVSAGKLRHSNDVIRSESDRPSASCFLEFLVIACSHHRLGETPRFYVKTRSKSESTKNVNEYHQALPSQRCRPSLDAAVRLVTHRLSQRSTHTRQCMIDYIGPVSTYLHLLHR